MRGVVAAACLGLLAAGCAGPFAGPFAGPSTGAASPAATVRLAAGVGKFTFTGWAGKPLPVHYFVPDKVDRGTRVVFVMHGMGRNADGYRDAWIDHAKAGNYIVVTPEFSATDFPGARPYNLGNISEEDGRPRPRTSWSFSAIEPLFDHVRKATGSRVPTYAIYGHSAGSQFVHRFLTFVPKARISHIIAANAGWYSLPVLDIDYPYGLRGTPIDRSGLAAAFAKNVTILLGTADIDPNHSQLSRTPGAMAQGPHRMARGQYYYARARAEAARLGVPFRWKLAYAPGIAHNNRGMSAAAAPLIWK